MQKPEKLRTKIKHCEITDKIHEIFTIEKKEYLEFSPHYIPEGKLPSDFNIGLIVGSSGSGKSILLKEFMDTSDEITWDDRAIASHFLSYKEAETRLLAAGLNSIPQWLLPYDKLSNGQKYRSDVARLIQDNIVFDEWTSVIDRNTAKSLSTSIQKYIRKEDLRGVIFACPHHDIIDYLRADWIYFTDTMTLEINGDFYNQEVIYFDEEFIKINTKTKQHFMEIKL